jgi:hypothetical protein
MDNPSWRIEDPIVDKMDKKRRDINIAVASFERQVGGDPFPYASLSTGMDIKKGARSVSRYARDVERDSLNAFDRAVYDDMVKHAQMANSYYSYFVDPNSNMGIGDFLSNFFVRGAYQGFLDSARSENLPHDLFKEEELLRAGFFSKTPDSLTICYGNTPWAKKHQENLLDALNRAREFVGPFYEARGVEKMDYNLQLGPAGGGFSYWIGNTLMAAIDPDRFSFSQGRYDHFLPGLILAHELGHGHQGRESNNLPKGLSPTEEEYCVSFHGACGEGVALALEGEFIEYSLRNSDLSELDKRAMSLFWSTYLPKKVFQIAHNLLEKKEQEEISNPLFPESLSPSAHRRLSEITGIKIFSDLFSMEDQSILDSLQQMNYQIGNKNLQGIVSRFKKDRIPKELRINALLQGVWVNPKAQEDFIFNSYLPRVLNE